MANGFADAFEVAELGDPDCDGVPTWLSYLANTNPKDLSSALNLSGWVLGFYQGSPRRERVLAL